MKRTLSFLLVLTMLVLCVVISANAAEKEFDEEIIPFDENGYVDPDDEQMQVCNATLEDDFKPDQVTVLLSHKESIRLLGSDELPDVFSSLDLKSVEDSYYQTQNEHSKYAKYYEEYMKNADASLNAEELEAKAKQYAVARFNGAYPHHHKLYRLTLNVSDKQAVLDTIRFLEESGVVYTAEPEYNNQNSHRDVEEDPSVINGDADMDDELTVLDATAIQRYMAGLIDEEKIDLSAADFDKDDEVTILDATAIQRYLVGLT